MLIVMSNGDAFTVPMRTAFFWGAAARAVAPRTSARAPASAVESSFIDVLLGRVRQG
jgi:hypothetical protein